MVLTRTEKPGKWDSNFQSGNFELIGKVRGKVGILHKILEMKDNFYTGKWKENAGKSDKLSEKVNTMEIELFYTLSDNLSSVLDNEKNFEYREICKSEKVATVQIANWNKVTLHTKTFTHYNKTLEAVVL